ncbi:MAG: hypothetical protein ACK5JH_12365 [Anaerocolumna sp.]
MNSKLKLGIPLCIICITIASAILAGSIGENKSISGKTLEVFAKAVTKEEAITQTKPMILSIIESNISNISQKDGESIRLGVQTHMSRYDKEQNQEFKVLLDNKLIDLEEIMTMEQSKSFQDMSLEARIPATKMLSDICKEYGIDITYDLNGNIVTLSGLSGESIYKNDIVKEYQGMRVDVLIGTLAATISLIVICIYITKKKQLFLKDGMYDGYNKEGFA